ncbi:aldehyde ferredoxin oxidoreductase family protein [Chloroflexota bacterium]
MASKGYAGKILRVNLSNGAIKHEPLDTEMARRFIGGWGMNARLAYDNIKPGTDAYSPDNVLIFGAGLLGGTSSPSTSKSFLTTKDPVSGTVSTAVGSSNLSAEMKWAGYDHLLITGKSKKPIYLEITDDDVKIHDAGHLWGKDLVEATDELRKVHGGTCAIVCIGPAGENLVGIAEVFANKLTTLGRSFGGVFGAKNLKAIVVDGTRGLEVADPDKFKQIVDGCVDSFMTDPIREQWTKLALHFVVPLWLKAGHLFPWEHGRATMPEKEGAEIFGPEKYLSIKRNTLACVSCRSGDKAFLEVKEGEYAGTATPASTPVVMGYSLKLGIKDINQLAKLLETANRYGIDACTFPGLVDWAIDLYERGILKKKDTGGLELKQGDFDMVMKLLEMTAKKEGFGGVLARGWLGAIKKIGKGSEKHAIIMKGVEPDFDARVSFGLETFGACTNPRPAHDMPVGGLTIAMGRKPEFYQKVAKTIGFTDEDVARIFTPEGFNLGRFLAVYEKWCTVVNSFGICFRMQSTRLYSPEICAGLYEAATGIPMTAAGLLESAERAYNVYRLINTREGFSRKDDQLPARWLNEPLRVRNENDVPLMNYFKTQAITKKDADKILDDYYDEHGWDKKTGVPTEKKLKELGLEMWVLALIDE